MKNITNYINSSFNTNNRNKNSKNINIIKKIQSDNIKQISKKET